MSKLLSILIITVLITSCVGSNNFHKQKFTNFKTSSAKQKTKPKVSPTFNPGEETYSKQNRAQKNSVPGVINSVTTASSEPDIDKTNTPQTEEYTATYSKNEEHILDDVDTIEGTETIVDDSGITHEPSHKEGETNYYALVGLISLFFFFLIFPLLIALICGAIAKRQIKNNPGKYNNELAANIAFWIPAILTGIIITYLVIILIGLGLNMLYFLLTNG